MYIYMNGTFIWINNFETDYEVYNALMENEKSDVYENIWKMDDHIMYKNVHIYCVMEMDIFE